MVLPGEGAVSELLSGRSALVTGAARGIGLATARALAGAGASVVLTDIDEEPLAEASRRLKREGYPVSARVMDVSCEEDRARLFAELGSLHVLVNNAAILDASSIDDLSLDRWRRVIEVNLTAALAVTQAALPALRRAQRSSVVNVASTQGLYGQPSSVAYASAKSGLVNLTRCMAVDLGEDGIRANAVAPGFIDTRMAITADGEHEHEAETFKRFYLDQGRIPLRRGGQPQDVGDVILFLASDLSRYVSGQVIGVDGGLTATY